MHYRTIQKRRARKWSNKHFQAKYKVDIEETYNLDISIVRFCLPRLKLFKATTMSRPYDATEEEWDTILQEIIDGLEMYENISFPTKEEQAKIDRGLDLLRKWFYDLWS